MIIRGNERKVHVTKVAIVVMRIIFLRIKSKAEVEI